MNTKLYLVGIVLGLIVPYIGIFVGLQVSSLLGTIFAFPIIVVAKVSGTPLGMFHPLEWCIAVLLSIFVWICIVAGLQKLLKK